jgi:uncharacterized membrane protein YkvA (DUF1232 family)
MPDTSDRPQAGPTPEGHDETGGPMDRSPQGLRDLLLFLPRLGVLLGKLIADPEVATADKLLLAGVVAYIMSPIDIVPDFIPVVGQIDDVYLVALCLLRLLNRSGEAKVRKYWEGPEDIVSLLNTITDLATRYLPQPARTALRGWIDARDPGAPPTGTA